MADGAWGPSPVTADGGSLGDGQPFRGGRQPLPRPVSVLARTLRTPRRRAGSPVPRVPVS